jgi:hypothetical protein
MRDRVRIRARVGHRTLPDMDKREAMPETDIVIMVMGAL